MVLKNTKRTMGVQRDILQRWVFPFSYAEWWEAAGIVYRTGETALCRVSRLALTGSAYPNLYVGLTTRKGVWAYCQLRGYGYGRMLWSVAPDVLGAWDDRIKKYGYEWVRKAHLNLWAHESWHLLMNTWSEDGTWPLTPALIAGLQQRWGVGLGLPGQAFGGERVAKRAGRRIWELVTRKREIVLPLDAVWMNED